MADQAVAISAALATQNAWQICGGLRAKNWLPTQHNTLFFFPVFFVSFVFLWQDQTAQTDERKNVARTMQKLWLGSAHRAL